MSLPDRNIDSKILKSAKDEFMAKGYADASLREICRRAGVTTGALYKRFPEKQALFKAIVEPTLKDIEELTLNVEKQNYELMDKNEAHVIWEMSDETLKYFITFFYDRYDGFRLLLCCAEGSAHSNFLHDFVTEHTRRTMHFVNAMSQKGYSNCKLSELELHMLQTAFWSTLFEPIVHGLSREEALQHCSAVAKFFNWRAVLGF